MKLRKINLLILCLAVCIAVGNSRGPKKIVRGQDAYETELPYQVSLQNGDQFLCGGSIISSYHILTAAHCVVSDVGVVTRPESIQVVTGAIDTQERWADNVFSVAKVIKHPAYGRNSYGNSPVNDIAILQVTKPIPFNEYQAPITLATQYTNAGEPVVVSGWGVANWIGNGSQIVTKLQRLDMTVVDLNECKATHPYQISTGNICAIAAPGSAACQGDSGGPLAHGNTLVGVVSWGTACAHGVPDVFANVAFYVPWIRSVTQDPEPW